MGTNFYWRANSDGQLPGKLGPTCRDSDSPRDHIGKRSAAGLYCWDCGCPCVETVAVSYPGSQFRDARRWTNYSVHGGSPSLDHCPLCLQNPPEKGPGLSDPGNPAGLELGFAGPLKTRPTGVAGASSFSWAQEPARVISICSRWPGELLVEDEYSETHTGADFLASMLRTPLWFVGSIGLYFS